MPASVSSLLRACARHAPVALALLSASLLLGAQAQPLVAGTLRIGLEASYPPFESWQGGQIVGFDPELAELLGREMKLKPVLVDTRFTNLILGLNGKLHDAVISGLYMTPERLAQADAVPYASIGALILVPKAGPLAPRNEKELCGVHVGLQSGTAWVLQLRRMSEEYCLPAGKPAVLVSEFPSAAEVSQALMSRNIEAQLELAGAATMLVERSRGRLRVSSPAAVYPQTLGIYMKKGNTALRKSFEQAMAALRASGEYQALLDKYGLTPVAAP